MFNRKHTLKLGIITYFMVLPVYATTYYVDPNGDDDANGSSWAAAFATIQKGIDTAVTDDIVEVNEGTYYENINFNEKAITVRSVDPNAPNIVAVTIIDANNPSLVVVTFDSGEELNSILNGLTITGGYCGIYCDSSSPNIMNCKVSNNSWGIVNYDSNSETTDCNITYNDTGVYCSGSSPIIANCEVSNNSWGIDNEDSDSITTNCSIIENYTGVYCSGSSPNIIDSNISSNSNKGVWAEYSNIKVIDCTISNNSGDGIYCYEQSPDIV